MSHMTNPIPPQGVYQVSTAQPRPEPRRRPVHRRKPEELGSMLADVMTLIETQVQPALTNGRYPDRKEGRQVAGILRAVARELDA